MVLERLPMHTLPSSQVDRVLNHLHLNPEAPTRDALDRILVAWSERIPWESMSRIARHQRHGTPEDYARFPNAYFDHAVKQGTGGTCFESNLALRALLNTLGYSVSLAFCDMEKSDSNPHCTVIVQLEEAHYLADVGYPVAGALLLDDQQTTQIETPVYTYWATPTANARWDIHRTSGDYRSLSFVVKGKPIPEADFIQRLIRDHQPDGLFLHNAIVARTIGGVMLRYSEDRGLVKRSHEIGEVTVELTESQQASLPAYLAALFQMDEEVLRTALYRPSKA